jgi:hypothetical protein
MSSWLANSVQSICKELGTALNIRATCIERTTLLAIANSKTAADAKKMLISIPVTTADNHMFIKLAYTRL